MKCGLLNQQARSCHPRAVAVGKGLPSQLQPQNINCSMVYVPMWNRLLLLAAVCAVSAAVEEHRIKGLPGLSATAGPHSHFSGYLGVDSLRIFYYYIQHPDPDAPLLIWMNGGPGASSMAGLFVEVGPFLLNNLSIPSNNNGSWRSRRPEPTQLPATVLTQLCARHRTQPAHTNRTC